MTDVTNSPTPASGQQPPRRSGIRRAAWIVALVAAAGLSGAALTSAFSHGVGFGPGHWRGGFHRGSMPFDPAHIEDRADRMVRHLAIELDASSDQQDRLRAVVRSAVKELVPMRDKVHSARQKARELLTQPTVDRAEIERFRTEQLALADAVSKRFAQAVGDAAEILTPEQRRKIGDHLPAHRERKPMWNR